MTTAIVPKLSGNTNLDIVSKFKELPYEEPTLKEEIIDAELSPEVKSKKGKGLFDKLVENVSPTGVLKHVINKGFKAVEDPKFQQEDTATSSSTSSAAGVQSEKLTSDLVGSSEQAKSGVEEAAKIYEREVAPQAALAAAVQGQTAQDMMDVLEANKAQFQKAVDETAKASKMYESALQNLSNQSKLDPQKYVSEMGVGKKTVLALGLVLSGIGSGLTGQPNMAMTVLQKNIERDISAQQQEYQRVMYVAAQRNGLIKTAMDKQIISSQALAAAQVSVLSGLKSMLESSQLKGMTQAQVQEVKALQLRIDQSLMNTYDQHAQLFKTVLNSGNHKTMNLLGTTILGGYDKLVGTKLDWQNAAPLSRTAGATAPAVEVKP